MRLLLLSGPIAVGKTSLRNVLISEHGFLDIRSGDYLRGIASSDTRSDLQNLGDELDRRTNYRWLLEDVIAPAISSLPQQNLWLIDAVRKSAQVIHIKEAYPNEVLHVHLTAPEATLRTRYQERQLILAKQSKYEDALNHDNEVKSRSLISEADYVLDATLSSPENLAKQLREATLFW